MGSSGPPQPQHHSIAVLHPRISTICGADQECVKQQDHLRDSQRKRIRAKLHEIKTECVGELPINVHQQSRIIY